MIKVFNDFRKLLDDIMLKCLNKRIVLFGYGRTGQFLEWYADYYHSIKIDYIVTDSDARGDIPYNFPVFRDSLFDFDYKDVKDAIVWLATDKVNVENEKILIENGYISNETYFDFKTKVFGDNLLSVVEDKSVFAAKSGIRDVQFMEYAEALYGLNLVSTVRSENFINSMESAHSYCITTQKEIFPVLDKIHFHPGNDDGIFDFGCGKGGALLTFLDYGFKNVGGVEYEDKLYDILIDNYQKMELLNSEYYNIELIHGDAGQLQNELDKYNYFYFFDPFKADIYIPCIKHICESYDRKPRKIILICINPKYNKEILGFNQIKLVNSFVTTTRQKVCNVYLIDNQENI